MKCDKDFKIGESVFIHDELEDKIVETVLSKFIRDENGHVIEYELSCKDEYGGYSCRKRYKNCMYETFDKCLEATIRKYRKYLINRSKENHEKK